MTFTQKKKSQTDLEKELGISRDTIEDYERDEMETSIEAAKLNAS